MRVGISDTNMNIEGLSSRTAEVVRLSADLVRIPSVTNCPDERVDEVFSCAGFISNFLSNRGLDVQLFDRGRYPALLVSFKNNSPARVMLSGHFDVVRPEPDDSQFEPRIEAITCGAEVRRI